MSEDDEGGIAPPTEQRGRLFHPGYAYALGAVLVLVFYVLRFVLHIEYVLDPEARMVPTVGREWAHGHHLREFAYYHYNPYQGSCLLDAFLSMLGYRVLGDHILSWQWVPFAYVAATTVAGMALLLRAGGAFAAFSFPLLLAGAPFLLKDGLLSIIGGHGSGPAFALAALALALGCGERRKGVDLRALFAGLCLGLGAWYMRTSAIAGPAVLLAVLARGGWKSLIPFALGLLSFPGLILWNAEALLAAGAPAAAGGKEALLQHMLWDVREIRQGGMPTAEKLRQAFGLSFERLLFAQPDALRTVEFAVRPGVPLRRAWTLAWQLSPPMVLALGAWHTLLPKRLPLREAWVGPLAVLLVITGYVGAYVASPFQVEDEVLNLTQGLMHGPGVNGTRYLVPIYLALTLGWALALGLVWELGRGRPWLGLLPKAAALALLGVTAGVGLNFAR